MVEKYTWSYIIIYIYSMIFAHDVIIIFLSVYLIGLNNSILVLAGLNIWLNRSFYSVFFKRDVSLSSLDYLAVWLGLEYLYSTFSTSSSTFLNVHAFLVFIFLECMASPETIESELHYISEGLSISTFVNRPILHLLPQF